MSEPVQSTENIFKNQIRKRLSIYGLRKTNYEETFRPRDVISCVTTQLKAYEVADSIKSNIKKNSKDLHKCKHSTFLNVNKLPVYVETPKQESKFNTQGITDSQLRNIIETAEIMEAQQGITQEFETDFVQSNTEIYEEEIKDLKCATECGTDVEKFIIKEDLNTDNDHNKSSVINDKETKEKSNRIDGINSDMDELNPNYNENTVNTRNIKEIHKYINTHSIENTQDDKIQASQILSFKTSHKINNLGKIKKVSDLKENNKNDVNVDNDHNKYSMMSDDETKIVIDGMCTSDTYVANSKYYSKDIVNDNNLKDNYEDNNIPTSQILNSKAVQKRKSTDNETNDYNLNIESSKNKALTPIVHYNEYLETRYDDTERSPSPIFPNNILKQNSNTPPLIFNLDKFEHFESIANPMIETLDFETAKHVINSQILNKELHINIDDISLQKRDVSIKSTNDFQHAECLNENTGPLQTVKTNSDEILNSSKSNIKIDEKDTTKNEILRDEILFSSDEEDCVATQEQNLLFTCALETSFSNQSDVLDKTVYVGFQTASNRSIQVCADSFARAKSLLNDVVTNEITVTDLVNNTKHTSIEDTKTGRETVSDSNVNGNDTTTESRLLKLNKGMNQGSGLADVKTGQFIGFRTANNKNITLSENSLVRHKKVFQDIDINEDFESKETSFKSAHVGTDQKKNESIRENRLENVNTTSDILQGIDDKIIQEFENVDMSLADNKKENIESVYKIKNNENEHVLNSNLITNFDKNSGQHNTIITGDQYINEINSNMDIGNINIGGFKTASNKIINISKGAWAKSRSVFENIDEIGISDTTSNISRVIGKLTNINKESVINELPKYLNHDQIKSPFECNNHNDLSTKTKQLVKNTYDNDSLNQFIIDTKLSSTYKGFIGFKTANNKAIKISEKAILYTKKVFNDIDSTNLPNKTVKEYPKTILEEENKHVNVNLTKSCNENQFIVPKMINKEHNLDNSNINLDSNTSCPVQLANNVHNTDSRTTNQANELTPIIDNNDAICSNISANASEPYYKFNGFETTGNKVIKVPRETLNRTKNIFKDIDSMDFESRNKNKEECPHGDTKVTSNELSNNRERDKNINVLTGLQCHSFRPASNKYSKMLLGSLSESEYLFENIDENFRCEELPNCNGKCETRSSSPVLRGYTSEDKNPMNTLKNNKELFKDLNKDVYRPSEFTDFLTASNKQVNVSEETLSISRKLLKEVDNINCGNKNAEIKPIYSKEIYQQENKKEKSKEVQNKIDSNSAMHINKALYNNESKGHSISFNKFTGFKTANNKIIKISDETLSRTKDIFKDIDLVDFKLPNNNKMDYPDAEVNIKKSKINTDNQIVNVATTKLQEFKTPSNKNALKQLDTMIQGIEIDYHNNPHRETKVSDKDFSTNDFINCNDNFEVRSTSPVFKGFQTGNRKPVTISEKALMKSKDLFKDLDIEMPLNSHVTSEFIGFQTASNKRVTVSEKALSNSRKIFKDIDNTNEDSENLKAKPLYPKEIYQNDDDDIKKIPELNTKIVPEFKGFHTASNKSVVISKSALEKSKNLFQDIDNTSQKKIDYCASPTDNTMTESFKETIKDRKEKSTLDISKNKLFIGFQTGNNEKINITEESLAKSKRLFSEIEDENDKLLSKNVKKKTSMINDENLNYLINTQVINNFDEALYTDDFRNTPERSKRSGSPILSCPRAKKRNKFETPYNFNNKSEPIPKSFNLIKKQSKIVYRDDYKKSKKYTLKDLKHITKDIDSKIDPYLLEFNDDNMLQIEFNTERNDISFEKITINSIKEDFLASVNAKLIPNGWLDNHLKLILWKLISYEIKFKTKICTVKNVLEQLKYRYDRELYNAERPALRKILEKDDVPSKTLVLCVVEIYADGVKVFSVTNATSTLELLVTDGWYCIRCAIDKMLSEMVCRNKIMVGTKLVTSGAELLECEQGVSPWEEISAVRLKIFGNSTRRAHWDARLGYYTNGAILSQLSSVRVLGGKVSKLRVFVTRVYPALYVEKFEDGSTVTRSERLENLHQMKIEADRQIFLEKICEEVEKEFVDQDFEDSEGLSDTCRKSWMESGSQIARMMKRSKDPAEFTAQLTASQTRLLQDHTSKNRDKLLQEMQSRVRERMEKAGVIANRNVVSLLKIRIAGVREKEDKIEITKGMMSIWKPTDSVRHIIREGAWVDIMNVVPTAIRFGEIQISAGRQSIFSTSKYKPSEKFKTYTKLLQRTSYTIKDLAQNPGLSTEYNEIDTVGFIFLIDPAMDIFDSTKHSFQNIYLSDADSNIICVHFWGGLKKFGFQNILDTGQVVFCGNLQKRAGNTRKSIPQFRVTELSYFTQTPKNEDAKKFLEHLKNSISSLDRRKFCDNCIVLKNNYSIIKQNNENISPYRCMNNSDINLSKNKIFIDSPLVRQSLQDNFNFSGLDFESTFKQDTQLSLEALKRKRKVNEKIATLEMYGEPPPLTHINIINRSKMASSGYKSPLLIENTNKSNIITNNTPKSVQNKNANDKLKYDRDVSSNVSNVKNSPRNCERTDGKCVNPVRINFDVPNDDSNVDPFAEDFDASPPLSLDDY